MQLKKIILKLVLFIFLLFQFIHVKKKDNPVEYIERTIEKFHRFFEYEASYHVSYEEKRRMEKKKN